MRILKGKQHGRFYVLLSLLLLLICVRYSLQVDIPRAVFLAIILVIAVMGDRDEITAMCMCCIPLHESIDLFYAVVFCIAVYALKFYRKIRINLSIIPILLIILWELLHCFAETFSIVGFVANMVPFLALAVFMSMDVSELDYDFVVRSFAVTVAGTALALLIRVMYQSGFNLAAAFAGLQRLGVDTAETSGRASVSGGVVNPNTLGIICVLATTALLQLRTVGRGEKKDMILVIILLVFGTLTASRTFLVCLAMMLVLLLFSQKGSMKQKLRFLGGMVLVLAFALLILYLLFPELLEYFYGRFLVKDITTGRMDIMGQYHSFIVSDPRILGFGIGLQDFAEKVTQTYRVSRHVPHNGIQELVAAWGLPGLILFGAMMVLMLWQSGKFCGRRTMLNYIPILILMLKIMAGQMISSPYTMLAFSYAYVSLAQNFASASGWKRS